MKSKVVVITGASSGIGQVAAEALARQGARIVQVSRDRKRGEAALARLQAINAAVPHSIYYADLSRLKEMKRVAAEIARAEPRVDVLMNNAGALFGERHLTEDGLELTFALNHLSYFVLTAGLRERLLAAAPSRVVNTSSDAHQHGELDFDDLQSEKAYRPGIRKTLRYGGPGFQVYARSKLCNILFTREAARRLAATGVTANCVHPGFVATRFGDESGGFLSFAVGVAKHFALTPEQGAETLIYLASSPEVSQITGEYFVKCQVETPSAAACDDEAARRLWTETVRVAGMDIPDGK